MSDSHVCLNARALLAEIEPLKQRFVLAYESARLSGSEEEKILALEAYEGMTKKLRELKEATWIVEAERTFRLREQYEAQLALLRKLGLPSYANEPLPYLMQGGQTKRIPSFKEVLLHVLENKELL